jgi:hypothetical protein
MPTFKYWKNDGYVRDYDYDKIEDLNQSMIKHKINENIRKKILESGELIGRCGPYPGA